MHNWVEQLRCDLEGMLPYVLGIGLLLLCQASLRFSGMTGIFPLEGTLTARHLLAFCVLVACAAVAARAALRPRTVRLLEAAAALLLTICFALSFGLGENGGALATVAEVAKEALIATLLGMWTGSLLRFGMVRALVAIGAADICQGLLQLATCWLQYEAHLVFIALVPLLSAAVVLIAPRHHLSDRAIAPSSCDALRGRMSAVFLLVTFFLALVVGQVIYVALESQQSMNSSAFAEVSMGLGNIAGGILVMAFAREAGNIRQLAIALAGTVAAVAITFYLSSFASGIVAGFFLTVSSCVFHIAAALPIVFAFTSKADRPNEEIPRYLFAFALTYFARAVSSTLMIVHAGSGIAVYQVIIAAMLVLLLACCAVLMTGAGALAEAAPESPSSEGVPQNEPSSDAPLTRPEDAPEQPDGKERPRPFRQAIDQMTAEHLLTPQESAVLALLAQGLNARSISEEMTLSTNTIRSHMRNAYAKLGVHSQQELIALVNERVEALKKAQ